MMSPSNDQHDPYRAVSTPSDRTEPSRWLVFPVGLGILVPFFGVLAAMAALGTLGAIVSAILWMGAVGWSVYHLVRRTGGSLGLLARSYLMSQTILVFLVGVVGTTCTGQGFGASRGDSGLAFGFLAAVIGSLGVMVYLFSASGRRR